MVGSEELIIYDGPEIRLPSLLLREALMSWVRVAGMQKNTYGHNKCLYSLSSLINTCTLLYHHTISIMTAHKIKHYIHYKNQPNSVS